MYLEKLAIVLCKLQAGTSHQFKVPSKVCFWLINQFSVRG